MASRAPGGSSTVVVAAGPRPRGPWRRPSSYWASPRAGPPPKTVDHAGAEAVGDVGQLHAVVPAPEVVVERDDLGELGGTGLLVEGRDVGPRGHQVEQGVAVDVLPERVRRRLGR